MDKSTIIAILQNRKKQIRALDSRYQETSEHSMVHALAQYHIDQQIARLRGEDPPDPPPQNVERGSDRTPGLEYRLRVLAKAGAVVAEDMDNDGELALVNWAALNRFLGLARGNKTDIEEGRA